MKRQSVYADRIDLDAEEPAEPYSFEGLREGILGIPSALYHATIGRLVRLIRGKPSKLDETAEAWRNIEGQGHFRGERQ